MPRAGGHSYGGYSTTSGVIVDVSRLNRISINAQGRAAIGAGARLIDVYDSLSRIGRTVPAGTCPTVGLAGLALGGGIGFAARKFGLTCDNLPRGDGRPRGRERRHLQREREPRPLLGARGGGGGNFGIATRLVFRSHPVGQVATYAIEWPWADAKRVVQAWQKFAPHAPDELFSVLNLNSVAGSSAAPRITSAGQFFGTERGCASCSAPLTSTGTPTRVTATTRSYLDAQRMWAGCSGTIAECHLPPQGPLGRSTFKGASSFANRPLTPRGIDAMIRRSRAAGRSAPGRASSCSTRTAARSTASRSARPPSSTVTRCSRCQYLAYWDPASQAAPNIGWLDRFHTAMRPYVSPFAYQNYIDPAQPNWKNAYYGVNLDRLVAVKRRYDPATSFARARASRCASRRSAAAAR